jgi:hypothetical protein
MLRAGGGYYRGTPNEDEHRKVNIELRTLNWGAKREERVNMDRQDLQDGFGGGCYLLYPVYPVHRCLNFFLTVCGTQWHSMAHGID